MKGMTQKSFQLIVWNMLEDTHMIRQFYGTDNIIHEVDGYADVLYEEYIGQYKVTDPKDYVKMCILRDFAESIES